MPATTVGRGSLGISFSAEQPVLDAMARTDGEKPDLDDLSGRMPIAATSLTVAGGVRHDTDLELSVQGMLLGLIPIPIGASIGVRHHLAATDHLDIAIAARIGGVTSGEDEEERRDSSEEPLFEDEEGSAIHGAIQAVAQVRRGPVRPMLALSLMPFRVHREPADGEAFTLHGLASSATLGLMLVGDMFQLGPYVTITSLEGDRSRGGWFPSGGFVVSFRPDRNR